MDFICFKNMDFMGHMINHNVEGMSEQRLLYPKEMAILRGKEDTSQNLDKHKSIFSVRVQRGPKRGK